MKPNNTKRVKVTAQLPVQIRRIDKEAREIDFIASDETVDRYHTIIEAKGWKLGNFRQNPIFLWGHNYRDPAAVMGRITKIGVDKDEKALMATAKFLDGDINPVAEMVFQMFLEKVLKSVSVGFIPLEYKEITEEDDTSDSKQTGGVKRKPWLRYTSQELLEISAVTVPANPAAVAKAVDSHLEGVNPVAVMAVKTALGDEDKLKALEDRVTCWTEENGVMIPCDKTVGEGISSEDFQDQLASHRFPRTGKSDVDATTAPGLPPEVNGDTGSDPEDLDEGVTLDENGEIVGTVEETTPELSEVLVQIGKALEGTTEALESLVESQDRSTEILEVVAENTRQMAEKILDSPPKTEGEPSAATKAKERLDGVLAELNKQANGSPYKGETAKEQAARGRVVLDSLRTGTRPGGAAGRRHWRLAAKPAPMGTMPREEN